MSSKEYFCPSHQLVLITFSERRPGYRVSPGSVVDVGGITIRSRQGSVHGPSLTGVGVGWKDTTASCADKVPGTVGIVVNNGDPASFFSQPSHCTKSLSPAMTASNLGYGNSCQGIIIHIMFCHA